MAKLTYSWVSSWVYQAIPIFLHTPILPIWQAIMASCAAPGYFSQVLISGSTHVDGAMVANNPTQLALLE